MGRLVQCNLCEGSGADPFGNRCIDCAGLGSYPHWRDRPVEDIERDLESTRTILNGSRLRFDIAETMYRMSDSRRKPQAYVDMEVARIDLVYWDYQFHDLESELRYARSAGKGVGRGNV